MRSLLFVPGDSPKKLAKGLASDADALLIDLEDSVAASAKSDARAVTAEFLTDAIPQKERPRLYVRINALDTGLSDADLDVVMAAAPDGIMLPKSQSGRDVTHLDAKLAVREATFDLEDGATRILVVATETAASLFEMGSYRGASRRLLGMAWGGEDLAADIGASRNRDEYGHYRDPYRLARTLCLLGAVSAGAMPLDSVYTNFRDDDGLRAEATIAMEDGFTGKMAIHPAQVPVINTVFTPNKAAIERAERIIAAFAASGDVGVVGLDGEMLDMPHLKQAEKIMDRARLAGVV
ncbi:MAG: CoA ester lyase [Hyphomicrobiales bacterium]|nr:MAG: CoA ester lyase [Hyphomicrobiales bacterium]